MKKLVILFMLFCSVAWAELPVPPVIQSQTTSTTQYMKDIYDNINIIPTTNTNPNGNRFGRYGQIVRYNNAGTYSLYTCISSPSGKAWQVVVPATVGIPAGGGASQALVKIDATDYNVTWADVNTLITSRTRFYVSNDNFTAPNNVTKVYLSGCGGGGGGGASGGEASATAGGGGGASGRWIINYPYTVVPGNTYSISIGLGGNGGTGVNNAPGNAGSNGTATVFDSTVSMAGGLSGSGGTGTTAGASGGSEYNGTNIGVSSPGDSGKVTNPGASGGATPWGAGGVGGTNGAGSTPSVYGGGGGGGRQTQGGGGGVGASGGNGADGILIVSW